MRVVIYQTRFECAFEYSGIPTLTYIGSTRKESYIVC